MMVMAKTETVWVATADTGSFGFTAWGHTRKDAELALVRGLLKHARQYNIPRGNVWADEALDGAWFLEIPAGGCMRDDYLL
jgi:hypothetical protein